MELWEAPLSNSALADVAPNETEPYEQKVTKHLEQRLAAKMQKIAPIYLVFYATIVLLFSFLEKLEVLEVGGYVCHI